MLASRGENSAFRVVEERGGVKACDSGRDSFPLFLSWSNVKRRSAVVSVRMRSYFGTECSMNARPVSTHFGLE